MLKKLQELMFRCRPLLAERHYLVDVDDEVIACQKPNGGRHAVELTALRSVAIQTSDEGPLGTEFWWHLEGDGVTLNIPQGARGEDLLLQHLQKLPGFDNEQVLLASSSTQNGVFLCWLRDRAGDDDTLRLQS